MLFRSTSMHLIKCEDIDKNFHIRCVFCTDFLNLNLISCERISIYLRLDEMKKSLSSFYVSTDYDLLKKQVDLANL